MDSGVTASDLLITAARLLKTSSINDGTQLEAFIEDAELIVSEELSPYYDPDEITSSNIPATVKAGVKYIACSLAITANFSTKSANEEAVNIADSYMNRGYGFIKNAIEGKRRFSELEAQSTANTANNVFMVDTTDERASDFLTALESNYFD